MIFLGNQNESHQPVVLRISCPSEYDICPSLAPHHFHSLSVVIKQPQNVTNKILQHPYTFFTQTFLSVFAGLNVLYTVAEALSILLGTAQRTGLPGAPSHLLPAYALQVGSFP